MKNFFQIKNKHIKKVTKEKIALYFYGGMAEVYQLEQWIEPLNALHNRENIHIIVRSKAVFKYLYPKLDMHITYIDTINDLLTFYEDSDFKVILYVNNGAKNFQSLIFHRAIHIHLNHGESEKSSMYSNQCKCYDYTFVVGDAAIDRYKRHMINIKAATYVKIGRPQYDHVSQIEKITDKPIILYAPTDESTHISMRYTSIEKFGLKIVDTILKDNNYYLVYRPHPSTGKNSKKVKEINEQIIKKIEASEHASIEIDINALDLLSIVDLAIFDNSSLIIDFLNFDKPMFVTDMFIPKYHNIKHFKMLDACILLNDKNINSLSRLIQSELENDTNRTQREKIRTYYLGNYKKGESTEIFIDKVLEAMEERDSLLKEKNMLDIIH